MRRPIPPLPAAALLLLLAAGAAAQPELSYDEYQAVARTSHRLMHCAMFEPLDGQVGMNLVVADRFGKLNVYHVLPGGARDIIWTSRQLEGPADEVLVADLDGDGLDDHIVCRTQRRVYAFKLDDFYNSYESQPNDFSRVFAMDVADVDGDPPAEIVINADRKLYYVDGASFTREFSSLNEYEATRLRCGDVTGDGAADIVLNSGQVVDASTGDVLWEDEAFGTRLELLDLDGDGVLEVFTENEGGQLKVWDIDFRQEKRF